MNVSVKPIGFVKSVFHFKNGTPRQSSLCEAARGVLTIEKSIFTNPEHSLEGLEEFSHVWLIFVFHKNNNTHTKAKVKPPRLNGKRVGVFATRSPYRPNNIGMSLVKLEKIEGSSIHVSGIDLIDGTPVLDIKPYIPDYDRPSYDILIQGRNQDAPPVVSPASRSVYIENSELECNRSEMCDSDTIISEQDEISRLICQGECESKNKILERVDNLIQHPITNCDKEKSVLDTEDNWKGFSSDLNKDERKTVHSIAEGFYAVSAALEKAGEKVSKTFCSSADASSKGAMILQDINFPDIGDIDPNMEDDDLDLLVSNIISQAAFDVNSKKTLGEKSEKLSHSLQLNSEQETHDIECSKRSRNQGESKYKGMSSTPNSSTKGKNPEICEETSVNVASLNKGHERSRNSNMQTFHDVRIENPNETPNNKNVVSRTCPQTTGNTEAKPDTDVSREVKSAPCKEENISAVIAPWLIQPPVSELRVTFTTESLKQLQQFTPLSSDSDFHLDMLSGPEEAEKVIVGMLREDPRSVYRRNHCQDSLYYFVVDTMHVTCWFDHEHTAQVVRVKPVSHLPHISSQNKSKADL